MDSAACGDDQCVDTSRVGTGQWLLAAHAGRLVDGRVLWAGPRLVGSAKSGSQVQVVGDQRPSAALQALATGRLGGTGPFEAVEHPARGSLLHAERGRDGAGGDGGVVLTGQIVG